MSYRLDFNELARQDAEARKEQDAIDRLADAIRETERDHPLPRCRHGFALEDGGGESLETPCKCHTRYRKD